MLATPNAAMQLFLPAWVRARGLSVYQIVLLGGMAVASAAWGVVAQSAGLPATFRLAAVLLAASALLRWPPPEVGHLDRSPAVYWPEPHLVLEPGPDVGPVLVSVTYKVAPDNARAFLAAMEHLRRSRLRTGAVRWELYRDGSDPRTFVEQFLVPSWDEHLRQHRGRLTGADRAIEERAVALADEPPVVAHLFPPDLEALEPDGPASEG